MSRKKNAQPKSAIVPGELAAIYCRISHANDDDQTGVDRQERINRDTAERLGLTVAPDHVYIDNNRSAWQRTRKRPGWEAMLEAMRKSEFRHVIAYHPDRLMRQPHDLEELLQIADDRFATLHGQANRRDLSDPDDRFFLRIEVAHACRSSDDTSRRLKDALEERADDRKPHSGKRRLGYTKDGMAIVESEAVIVREVFDRYLRGDGLWPIARSLNARGVKTAYGKAWTAGTLRALLDSRHVASIRVHRGEEIGDGIWPAIIDRGTWDEVRQRRLFRSAKYVDDQEKKRFYVLRGLLTCAKCGTQMSGSKKGDAPHYACTRLHRADDLKCSRRIKALEVEEFVRDAALDLLERLTVSGEMASATVSDRVAETIDADRRQLRELNDMWTAKEVSTAEYRQMRKSIEDRIAKAQRRTVVRPLKLIEGVTGPGARKAWFADDMTDERRNAILRFLFSAVRIEASTKPRGVFDWDRIKIDQNPL
ncbi:recombinase family protein [Embleya sp. NPDC127516]|uniref:recombinase family protein n=1 Tax=Embleya sp. NPDC127516 TaxID=3363990 RepID=UPI0037F25D78